MKEAVVAIDVLGPLRITANGNVHTIGRNQRASILANLICRAGQSVTYDTLADELGTARLNVMKAKAKLRLDLQHAGVDPDDVLISEPDGYRLVTNNIVIDAHTFDEAVSEAEIVVDGDASHALYLVTAALKLWSNPFQGVPATFAIDDEAVRLVGVHRRARLVRCAALLGTSQVQLVETEARAMLSEEADDEAACHYLVLALGKLGRQFEALDELARLNEVRAERGTEPSAALLGLQDQIVRGEVSYEPHHRPNPKPQWANAPVLTRVRVNTSTKLVGNRELLGRMDSLRAQVQSGVPAVCWIEAGAGFGKTRVVEEWASRRAPIGFRPCWLSFRQNDDGAFRRHVQLLSEILSVEAQGKARLGDDLIAEVLDQRLIAAIMESAQDGPILVVFEDVHWADARSLGFIDRLVADLNRQGPGANRPVMVVATSRPIVVEDRLLEIDRIRRGRVVASMDVEPLNALDVHELLVALGVAEPASSMVSTVRTVTAGNPLAIRTLLKRLDQTRGLATLHGQTVITHAEAEVRQFSSLDSLVSSHVLAASEECRRVLAIVAVLGEHATRHMIDWLDNDTDTIEVGVGEAVRSGLLVPLGRSALSFEHPVVAQAALADVRPTDLQALHLSAANMRMADPYRDPSAVTAIADHLIRSNPLADDADIVECCQQAGELALQVASWSDANRYLSAALASAERVGVSQRALASLRLLTATAAFRDHQIGVAASLFRQVADHGRDSGDAELWGQGLVDLARCVAHNPDAAATQEPYDGLIDFLAAAESSGVVSATIRARAHQQLATLDWSRDDYAAALRHANRALSIVSVDDEPLVVAQASLLGGLASYGSLDLAQALTSFDASIQAATSASSSIFHHWGLSRAAMTNWALGELDRATRQASQAADAAGAASNWAEACLATTILAGTCHALGFDAEAAREADKAQQLFDRSAFYWAGTLLLPVRIRLAASSVSTLTVRDVVAEWNRPLPMFLRVRIAIDDHDAGSQEQLRQRLVRRQPFGEPTMKTLPAIVAAAELAAELNDIELARACVAPLERAASAGVVVVPGQNHPIATELARCRELAG